MSTALTPLQEAHRKITAAMREAERRILPAKLVDPLKDGSNGYKIAGYLKEHGLDKDPSADNFEKAIKALYRELEWQEGFKPAKLVMEENETKVTKITPVHKSAEAFAAKLKAGEVAAEKAKEDAKFEKETASLIANYQEVNKAGRVAYGAQESHKKRISDWVAANKGRVSAEEILKAVQNEINRLYVASEKERERV
jgi:hypothetical protein